MKAILVVDVDFIDVISPYAPTDSERATYAQALAGKELTAAIEGVTVKVAVQETYLRV